MTGNAEITISAFFILGDRMNETTNIPSHYQGCVKWESPSNIALVKYWGKRGVQLPQNPSISFTLSHCKTVTAVHYQAADRFSLQFSFEGKEQPAFAAKVERFLLGITEAFPWLLRSSLRMESRNTFPHSSGIASSASSMSALTLCLMDIDRTLRGGTAIDFRQASHFARLASGSASRSIFPEMALWGKTDARPDSSDTYALPLGNDIHPVFKTYRDSILIVSDAAKSVSSRAGHALMEHHPYAAARYQEAARNIQTLLKVLETGDLETFIHITESEAMQLHALMLCSTPSFMLMKPQTLSIIAEIRRFREATHLPVCFTLDAGPNVHVLYPEQHAETVKRFIQERLAAYCHEAKWIQDHVGKGPQKLTA